MYSTFTRKYIIYFYFTIIHRFNCLVSLLSPFSCIICVPSLHMFHCDSFPHTILISILSTKIFLHYHFSSFCFLLFLPFVICCCTFQLGITPKSLFGLVFSSIFSATTSYISRSVYYKISTHIS